MFKSAQCGACAQSHRHSAGELAALCACAGRELMLLILAVLAVAVLVGVSKVRVPGGVNAADLGSVSNRWLADYRASHPS
jgi:hypothetical protein